MSFKNQRAKRAPRKRPLDEHPDWIAAKEQRREYVRTGNQKFLTLARQLEQNAINDTEWDG